MATVVDIAVHIFTTTSLLARKPTKSVADTTLKVNKSMQVYLVGGAVRDELLGYPTDEFDYVVVGSSPEQMREKGFTPVGKDFPVFLHPKTKEEYALARTERKSGHGYQGFTFNAAPNITLEQDLMRRDLTINAIAKSDDGEYIDPYHGQIDIEKKLLRHVSDAFREDPVRILRTARFAARYHHLGFRVADTTLQLMRAMVENGEASHLVAERVWKEFSRAICERSPEVFIDVLDQCGALAVITPEIRPLLTESKKTSLESTEASSNKAINALVASATISDDCNIRIAAMLHDFSIMNPATHKSDLARFFDRLNTPKETRAITSLVTNFHHIVSKAAHLSANELLDFFSNCDAFRRPERFESFLIACHAYHQGQNPNKEFPQMPFLLKALESIHSISAQPFINKGIKGKDIGEAISNERIERLKKYQAK